jgi:bisphosphoglycerate-independent phosphoglycerate mutase (AlkP superfamily)
MRVPLVVNKKVADKHIRTVDLFPTILDYLNKEIPNEVDGKKLDID